MFSHPGTTEEERQEPVGTADTAGGWFEKAQQNTICALAGLITHSRGVLAELSDGVEHSPQTTSTLLARVVLTMVVASLLGLWAWSTFRKCMHRRTRRAPQTASPSRDSGCGRMTIGQPSGGLVTVVMSGTFLMWDRSPDTYMISQHWDTRLVAWAVTALVLVVAVCRWWDREIGSGSRAIASGDPKVVCGGGYPRSLLDDLPQDCVARAASFLR